MLLLIAMVQSMELPDEIEMELPDEYRENRLTYPTRLKTQLVAFRREKVRELKWMTDENLMTAIFDEHNRQIDVGHMTREKIDENTKNVENVIIYEIKRLAVGQPNMYVLVHIKSNYAFTTTFIGENLECVYRFPENQYYGTQTQYDPTIDQMLKYPIYFSWFCNGTYNFKFEDADSSNYVGEHYHTPERSEFNLQYMVKVNPYMFYLMYRLQEITNIKSKMNQEMRYKMRHDAHYLQYRTKKSMKHIDYKLGDEKSIQNSFKPNNDYKVGHENTVQNSSKSKTNKNKNPSCTVV
jgi:hypothetical protein